LALVTYKKIEINDEKNMKQKTRSNCQDIDNYLTLIIKYIAYIKACNTLEEVQPYFMQLLDIHTQISKMIFEEEIAISDALWTFFKDFDRIDDPIVQQYIFEKIKAGSYAFNKDQFLWYR
jgi:hypothetical protein